MTDEPVTHAGGVVYRRRGGALEFLLVRSKDRTRRVLPKGHIDPGEDEATAAAREVREEAGYRLSPGPRLGVFTFDGPKGPIATAYFLMEDATQARRGKLKEKFRDPQWFSLDAARRADLPVPDVALAVLDAAQRALGARLRAMEG